MHGAAHVQPVCFWDEMPIPRHALTVRFMHSLANAMQDRLQFPQPPWRMRATLHDYHPQRDKVNEGAAAVRSHRSIKPKDSSIRDFPGKGMLVGGTLTICYPRRTDEPATKFYFHYRHTRG